MHEHNSWERLLCAARCRGSSEGDTIAPKRVAPAGGGARTQTPSGTRPTAAPTRPTYAPEAKDRRDRSRGASWQYLFVAIDDATRLGFGRIYPDETARSALAFLTACDRFYHRHGIPIERVLTDNGTCFKQRWHDACTQLGIGVRKTRPYRPQTNGNAERFIRTLLERWAYAYT